MSLLNYQIEAREHLVRWKVGALFMEPGTGKTRVACELVNDVAGVDLVVWIGPLRTIRTGNGVKSISDEISKWGGFNSETVFYGIESIGCSDRIYLEVLGRISSSSKPFIVVDESLKIKNAFAKRTKRLLEIGKRVEYKLILNGTPLSKNLMDLWSQMEFLSPKILNMSLRNFKNTFCRFTTVTKKVGGTVLYSKEFITGYENIDYLYSLIRNYVYECDLNLNISQNYRELNYSLTNEEIENYVFIRDVFLQYEMLEYKNNNIFLEMTQKMQHSYCCCVDKFRVVDSIFEFVPEEKTIIFCKYIDSVSECEKRYPKALVLSYQKNSFGINIQDRNNTIYFDKIWDYALRIQAGHRNFRTGQEFDCRYFDLTATNCKLDSLIDRNIEKKIGMSEYFKSVSLEQLKKDL